MVVDSILDLEGAKLGSQIWTEMKAPPMNHGLPWRAIFLCFSESNLMVKKSTSRTRLACIFQSSDSFVLRYWWLNFLPKALIIIEKWQGAYNRCLSSLVRGIDSSPRSGVIWDSSGRVVVV